MDELTPAETSFVLRRLLAAAPHVQALAPLLHRDELAHLCRAELTGVDVRVGGWDIRGRWFGVVVVPPPRYGRPRRAATIEWRVVALHIARTIERLGVT